MFVNLKKSYVTPNKLAVGFHMLGSCTANNDVFPKMFLVVKCPIYTFSCVLGSQSKLLICGCGKIFCWFVVVIV